MKLSIITATYMREPLLKICREFVRSQLTPGFEIEHIVVHDGPSNTDHCLAEHVGKYGAACKDKGIELATGEYVAFFDDDNFYETHAAMALLSVACGSDIGICRTHHKEKLIPNAPGALHMLYGEVDSMCLCVKTELARKEKWADNEHNTDWNWLCALEKHSPTVSFSPVIIGRHMVSRY